MASISPHNHPYLKPISIAPLVLFRIIFGGTMALLVAQYLLRGWFTRYWVEPAFQFKYLFLPWISDLPDPLLYGLFILLGVLGLFIMFGFHYRLSSLGFFLLFSYFFFVNQANYLNEFYLFWLCALLMCVLPASQCFSLDARKNPQIQQTQMPAWCLWILRFQIALPYIFGGLAKLNSDWFSGAQVNLWLGDNQHLRLIGPFLQYTFVEKLIVYGGCLFDLAIIPMLLYNRTRFVAIIAVVLFHIINAFLFKIGILTFFLIASTFLFLPPDYFQDRLNSKRSTVTTFPLSPLPFPLKFFLITFITVQLLLPLRHYLYPGPVQWTREGFYFAWQMRVGNVRWKSQFTIHDPQSGQFWTLDLKEEQQRKNLGFLSAYPDLLIQYAHYIASIWNKKGYNNVRVTTNTLVSLNGKPYTLLIDPQLDLAQIQRSLTPATWIEPPPP